MAIKTKTIEVKAYVELTYDDASPEIKEVLGAYRECISSEATLDDILRSVAIQVARYGTSRMIEGVGYVSFNGSRERPPFSGITVGHGFDDFHADIE